MTVKAVVIDEFLCYNANKKSNNKKRFLVGHSVQYYEIEVAKGKEGQMYIENIANEDAINEGDYNSSLNSEIRWIDEIYDDYNSVEKAIDKYDKGWGGMTNLPLSIKNTNKKKKRKLFLH